MYVYVKVNVMVSGLVVLVLLNAAILDCGRWARLIAALLLA